MGTLSIPVEVHKKLPSTGQNGYDKKIRKLKTTAAEKAEKTMNDYENKWKELMQKGVDGK